MPKPLDNESQHDSLHHLPSHNKQLDSSTGGSYIGKTPPFKRNTSTPSVYRQGSVGMSAPKKRLPGIGAASSYGRFYKVAADFFLLAGRTEDALTLYVNPVCTRHLSRFLSVLVTPTLWHSSSLRRM